MKKSSDFKKKVIVTDEKSTAEARAYRLKRVRNMANLTREEMCNDETINIYTYKGWEWARYGGLPLDGAEKVIDRIAKEGVVCTPEWLIYEIGKGPYVIADFKKVISHKKNKPEKIRPQKEESLIFNEILLFRKQFKDTIDFKVSDDGLSPAINKNDFVAGIKVFNESIKKFINQACIIQLENGDIIVRHLKQGSSSEKYVLACTNPNTIVSEPVLYDIKITCVAPILRIYKTLKE